MHGLGGRSGGRAPGGDVGRASLALVALAVLGLAHCGGQSVLHSVEAGADGGGTESRGGSGGPLPGGGSGATANGGAKGGAPAGGTGGSSGGGTSGSGAKPGDCYYYGTYYEMGAEFIPEDDPCTLCICNNVSRVVCTERDCTTCVYEGAQHPINESFPAKDGCNSCNCDEDGNVYCGHSVCERILCRDLQAKFAEEVAAHKSCPSRADETGCVVTARDSLPCGCTTAVWGTLTLDAIAAEYYANGCGGDAICPPCNSGGSVAFCSDGTCVLGGYL